MQLSPTHLPWSTPDTKKPERTEKFTEERFSAIYKFCFMLDIKGGNFLSFNINPVLISRWNS
jgi:hypothetical protein